MKRVWVEVRDVLLVVAMIGGVLLFMVLFTGGRSLGG